MGESSNSEELQQ